MPIKNCIITGGTSGLGYELSKVFSKKYKIHIIAKDRKKFIQKFKLNKNYFFYKTDLSNLNSIKKTILKIKKIKNIDVLILNAAIIEENNKLNAFKKTFLINYISNFFFITSLLNKFKKNKKKTIIINISSYLHKFANLKKNKINFIKAENSWVAYSNSKIMNLLLFNRLNTFYKKKIITINIDPGWLKTNFGNKQKNLCRKILNFLRYYFANSPTPIANFIFDICESYKKKYNGSYISNKIITNSSKISHNKILQNELWVKSLYFLNKQ
jgi:NAD(P)-dependent dehydrogenase (short-subunit alcohol dehydrogenase family)